MEMYLLSQNVQVTYIVVDVVVVVMLKDFSSISDVSFWKV
jgi:hypothetical protein